MKKLSLVSAVLTVSLSFFAQAQENTQLIEEQGAKDLFVVDSSYDHMDNYGEISPADFPVKSVSAFGVTREAECRVTGNNSGCSKNFICPSNQEITAYKVGCNLEYGAVTNGHMNNIPFGSVSVVRKSDKTRNGSCKVGRYEIKEGTVSRYYPVGQTAVTISCKEHDKNGGDCHIRAEFVCSNR